MRVTVARKIVGAVAIIIVVATLALLVVYDGLSRVVEEMRQLAQINEPSYSATLEVELNLNGIVLATFAYLDDPDPRHRELIKKDQRDIALFYERFIELAESEADRRLGTQLGKLYGELQTLADSMLNTRDQQASSWAQVTESFARADNIIDTGFQAPVGPDDAAAAAKLNSLRSLKSNLAAFGVWLGNYQRTYDPRLRGLIAANAEEFRTTLRRLRASPLRRSEDRHAAALDQAFERMAEAIWPVLDLRNEIQQQSVRLMVLRSDMDQLLDEQIQLAARNRLYEPRREAQRVASTVLDRLRWLVVLVLAVAVAAVVLLIRSISNPIRRLKAGAETVGRGDLSHRISIGTEDEFAGVAAEFNRMVEQLQATTVSKELLEQSERRLRHTVAQLRQEIADRLRAESEQSRLEASLRRSETMSAMGALVGGVAHEVRNPLFGILSVLEAMDARLGDRQDYQRYLTVLREQAHRLNRLMRDLLEYGKPPNPELTRGSIADLLSVALADSRPAADQAGVRLVGRIAEDSGPLLFDRNRLLRVFLNLFENAIQHTAPGETVTFESRMVDEQGGSRLECTVADTGPGFRDEDLPHVFEPFFSRRREGTGLGLSIVQRIVEEHGGRITAANGRERGAVMTVSLPVAAAVPAAGPVPAGCDAEA